MKLEVFKPFTPFELLQRIAQFYSPPLPNGKGNRVAVTTTAYALPTLPDDTGWVMVEAVDGDLTVSFDGTAPSASYGHKLAMGDVVLWPERQAVAARFYSAASVNMQWTPFS